MIDLRSDTVTKPTPGMMEAMMHAEIGDDVFGEDPSINQLEEKAAHYFGMEAGLFCPSGTMTNQIGIRILSNPYEEVICYDSSHIYKWEGGGVAGNSGLSFKLLPAQQGKLRPEQISTSINPDDIHYPISSILALENTVNKGGGSVYTLTEIKDLVEEGRKYKLKSHLDGARLFNAIVATGDNPQEYGKYFDTISICLSKGLGAPVGSVLLGSEELIKQARRVRKHLGGGMRQAGFLAAAAIYALDHHVERLALDHKKAKELGSVLEQLSFVQQVLPVESNIVIFELNDDIDAPKFLNDLEHKYGIQAVSFGGQLIRFVTHLDFTDDQMNETVKILRKIEV